MEIPATGVERSRLPAEILLFVVAVVLLVLVALGRRGLFESKPPSRLWFAVVPLIVSTAIALVSELWIGAAAMFLMLVALVVAAVRFRHPA